jgi:hypothetical protein
VWRPIHWESGEIERVLRASQTTEGTSQIFNAERRPLDSRPRGHGFKSRQPGFERAAVTLTQPRLLGLPRDGGSEMLESVDSTKRRVAIVAEIARLGPVVTGTISQRSTRYAGVGCHCRADPPVLHDPCRSWTHQQEGRQVTKTLSAQEAARLGPAIAANTNWSKNSKRCQSPRCSIRLREKRARLFQSTGTRRLKASDCRLPVTWRARAP